MSGRSRRSRPGTRSARRSTPRKLPRTLDPGYEKRRRRDKAAWAFFEAGPPSYRRLAAYWVMSAKKEETRQRRLAKLIAES